MHKTPGGKSTGGKPPIEGQGTPPRFRVIRGMGEGPLTFESTLNSFIVRGEPGREFASIKYLLTDDVNRNLVFERFSRVSEQNAQQGVETAEERTQKREDLIRNLTLVLSRMHDIIKDLKHKESRYPADERERAAILPYAERLQEQFLVRAIEELSSMLEELKGLNPGHETAKQKMLRVLRQLPAAQEEQGAGPLAIIGRNYSRRNLRKLESNVKELSRHLGSMELVALVRHMDLPIDGKFMREVLLNCNHLAAQLKRENILVGILSDVQSDPKDILKWLQKVCDIYDPAKEREALKSIGEVLSELRKHNGGFRWLPGEDAVALHDALIEMRKSIREENDEARGGEPEIGAHMRRPGRLLSQSSRLLSEGPSSADIRDARFGAELDAAQHQGAVEDALGTQTTPDPEEALARALIQVYSRRETAQGGVFSVRKNQFRDGDDPAHTLAQSFFNANLTTEEQAGVIRNLEIQFGVHKKRGRKPDIPVITAARELFAAGITAENVAAFEGKLKAASSQEASGKEGAEEEGESQ